MSGKVSPEELEALVNPRPGDVVDPELVAREVLRAGLGEAAAAVVEIVKLGVPADKVKLDAAKYVLDRGLGKVGSVGNAFEVADRYLKEAEEYANRMGVSGE